jgi:hypothetical protein
MIGSILVKIISSELAVAVLKRIVMLLLRELVKSTKNDLDDKIVDEVEKALN